MLKRIGYIPPFLPIGRITRFHHVVTPVRNNSGRASPANDQTTFVRTPPKFPTCRRPSHVRKTSPDVRSWPRVIASSVPEYRSKRTVTSSLLSASPWRAAANTTEYVPRSSFGIVNRATCAPGTFDRARAISSAGAGTAPVEDGLDWTGSSYGVTPAIRSTAPRNGTGNEK